MGNEAADVQKGQSTHQAPREVILHQYHRKTVKSFSSTRRVHERDHHRSLRFDITAVEGVAGAVSQLVTSRVPRAVSYPSTRTTMTRAGIDPPSG